VSSNLLNEKNIELLTVDRGGRTTYHGPGQIVGFPLGTLADFVGDSRGVRKFIEKLVSALEWFVESEWRRSGDRRTIDRKKAAQCPGVWARTETGELQKIASIGLAFHRGRMAHGFALNVDETSTAPFQWIHPCGEPDTQMSCVYPRAAREIPAVSARLRLTLASAFEKAIG